jgi:hypothetical protein
MNTARFLGGVVADAIGEVEQHVEQELEVALVLAQVPTFAEVGVEQQRVLDMAFEHLAPDGVADGPQHRGSGDAAERQSGQRADGGDGILRQLTGEIADQLRRQKGQRNRGDEEDDVGGTGRWVARPPTEVVGLLTAERPRPCAIASAQPAVHHEERRRTPSEAVVQGADVVTGLVERARVVVVLEALVRIVPSDHVQIIEVVDAEIVGDVVIIEDHVGR